MKLNRFKTLWIFKPYVGNKPFVWKVDFDFEDLSVKIPPLLLIPFVENAYKHGELHNENYPIDIELKKESNQLIFRVTNLIKKQEKDQLGGIGLNNIKKRLQLLYGDQHKLKILNENGNFNAWLQIPLN